jgi:hypothetical protein
LANDAVRTAHPSYAERDIRPTLAAAGEALGEWSLVGRVGHGAFGGAWEVANRNGHRAVLKCVWDADWRPRLATAADVVDRLHARGALVPRFLACGYAPEHGTWYLQELLDGSSPARLDPSLLGDILHLSDLQAQACEHVPAAFDWASHICAELRDDAAGDLERVVDRIGCGHTLRAALSTLLPDSPGGTDAVHGDLLITQLLVHDGRLAAVVDWEGAGRGERAQDLALLLYNIHAQADRTAVPVDEHVADALAHAAVDRSGAEEVSRYLAYHALHALGYVLAHNPHHAEWRLDLARRSLARLARTADVPALHELQRLLGKE